MGLRSSFAFLPFDIVKTWPGLRVRRVRGEVNGFSFRTALFPTPRGHGFFVNKKMLAGAGARQGERVTICIEPDLEKRKESVPEELVRALRGAAGLRKWFDALPPAHRRWIAQFIAEPKTATSRQKRADDTAERLYLAMEGEKETPPILRAAFQHQPLAETGWKAFTAIQRRNHLFAIFGCRSAEARQKRLEMTIAEALARTGRNADGSRNLRAQTNIRRSWDPEIQEQ